MHRGFANPDAIPAALLVDTNILLLAAVHALDPALVARFKRTANRFREEDGELLRRVLVRASHLFTTPHVLAETSNLLGQLPGSLADRGRAWLVNAVSTIEERYVSAVSVAEQSRSVAVRLGITDAALVQLTNDGLVLLTDDALLANAVYATAGEVINFNHLREFDI